MSRAFFIPIKHINVYFFTVLNRNLAVSCQWTETPQSLRDSSPFMGAFSTRKPSLKGKVANRRFDGRVLKPSPQGEGAEQSKADDG